jgi:hypothetical protein
MSRGSRIIGSTTAVQRQRGAADEMIGTHYLKPQMR